jgi:hypothetical protein
MPTISVGRGCSGGSGGSSSGGLALIRRFGDHKHPDCHTRFVTLARACPPGLPLRARSKQLRRVAVRLALWGIALRDELGTPLSQGPARSACAGPRGLPSRATELTGREGDIYWVATPGSPAKRQRRRRATAQDRPNRPGRLGRHQGSLPWDRFGSSLELRSIRPSRWLAARSSSAPKKDFLCARTPQSPAT